ncbi:MAM domain-containing glycosylphosphatidylinositol anchor protein 1 [Geodia barretti]|uniref:MAM domain-containing glycosylphosphatidylinositol anchor protein 1 n=1 Tax=Geodia barretti TaxID=519541 RepID=A0AA35TKP0_GEOBA|nr:MAM domain-containing glycosylphosphatidylinositol anchor protein 1 [Geodia barretti]
MSVKLVGSGSREVGSVYTLTCTVALSHRARDSSVSIQWHGPSTDEQTVDTTDNRELTSQLSLDPLSLAHGGDYTCTASYTVDGGTTVTTSDTERVIPIIAPPSVVLRISEDTILVGEDVVVYCDIDLIGVVRGRDVAVEVTWFQEGVPVRPDSRLTISGATGDVGGVHSSLTFSPVHFSDMATYECRVTLTPLLGPASPVSSSASIFLNISEPVDPVRPEDVTFREVQSDSVTVQWRVSHISYSPETYVVHQLSGLRDNTTYYVQVLATNTALRSSRSSVESFTTLVTPQMTADMRYHIPLILCPIT